MNIRRRALSGIAAAIAMTAAIAGGSLAIGAAREPTAKENKWAFVDVNTIVFDRGPINGIVAEGQSQNSARTHVAVSLQGLASSSEYLVVGSSRPCSQPASRATSTYAVKIEAEGSSAFDESTVTSAATERSVRVFLTRAGESPAQEACGIITE